MLLRISLTLTLLVVAQANRNHWLSTCGRVHYYGQKEDDMSEVMLCSVFDDTLCLGVSAANMTTLEDFEMLELTLKDRDNIMQNQQEYFEAKVGWKFTCDDDTQTFTISHALHPQLCVTEYDPPHKKPRFVLEECGQNTLQHSNFSIARIDENDVLQGWKLKIDMGEDEVQCATVMDRNCKSFMAGNVKGCNASPDDIEKGRRIMPQKCIPQDGDKAITQQWLFRSVPREFRKAPTPTAPPTNTPTTSSPTTSSPTTSTPTTSAPTTSAPTAAPTVTKIDGEGLNGGDVPVEDAPAPEKNKGAIALGVTFLLLTLALMLFFICRRRADNDWSVVGKGKQSVGGEPHEGSFGGRRSIRFGDGGLTTIPLDDDEAQNLVDI